jgi:LuxR family transcriptional regulator, maltose regulon positive regulatory protein
MRPLSAEPVRMPPRLRLVPAVTRPGPEADVVAGRVARLRAGGVVARPGLFGQLGGPARVTVVSAPAGSGKTVLLRSWISQAGLAERVAWVAAGREERDPQRFWLSVLGALRQTVPGAGLVRAVSAAPDVDGWGLVERLLEDLAALADPVWLVVDDVHELGPEVLRQLELLVLRAPPRLRFVLAARHDVRLGLHRLRLEGGLAEIRAADLRFSLAEARELFAAAGIELPGTAAVLLHERTEGWVAGLRLAALSLAGHPDPERFAAEFSGSERMVAEYLLAEVLDRQSERVRRLLLRTSILDRVNGELAHLLTGDEGAERVLQDLEAAGAFVVALDAARSWFRYHQMFAGLLRLELRRAEPGEVTGLHQAAAEWLAGQGFAAEAVRQAQAAGDWGLAARLLAGHWPALRLDGQAATIHELLAGFPDQARAADAEVAVVAAADELVHGSLEAAERYLTLAERHAASVPQARRPQLGLLLGLVQLQVDRQRGDLPAVTEQAGKLQAMAEAAETASAQYDLTPTARAGLGADLSAVALINLGSTERWAASDDAPRHLERGVELARRIGRPYLEFTGLAYQATIRPDRSFARAAERGLQAVELARRHGWTGDPAFGVACFGLGAALAMQVRPDEAEPWVQLAERVFRTGAEPAAALGIRYLRGTLEQERGRDAEALAAFQAAESLGGRFVTPHYLALRARAQQVHSLLRLGQVERAEEVLARLSRQDREHGDARIAAAALRLAQGDPDAALTELAPVLDGPVGVGLGFRLVTAHALEAATRDALGDRAAAEIALERALDLAEPTGVLQPFLQAPVLGLVEHLSRHRTAHASLIAEIRSLLAPAGHEGAGSRPMSRGGLGGIVPPRPTQPLLQPLSGSEVRVLRYLPTNLTMPEIARQLSVSPNTIRTHARHLYAKLGTRSRAGTVESARALGLLAPAGLRPPQFP